MASLHEWATTGPCLHNPSGDNAIIKAPRRVLRALLHDTVADDDRPANVLIGNVLDLLPELPSKAFPQGQIFGHIGETSGVPSSQQPFLRPPSRQQVR